MQFIRIQLNILHTVTNPALQCSASVWGRCCTRDGPFKILFTYLYILGTEDYMYWTDKILWHLFIFCDHLKFQGAKSKLPDLRSRVLFVWVLQQYILANRKRSKCHLSLICNRTYCIRNIPSCSRNMSFKGCSVNYIVTITAIWKDLLISRSKLMSIIKIIIYNLFSLTNGHLLAISDTYLAKLHGDNFFNLSPCFLFFFF